MSSPSSSSPSRIIVLTGASRGLGRVMAKGFAKAGHRVFGCGRDQTKLDSLARELGHPHEFQRVDVCKPSELEAWAKGLRDRGIVPDLLVNNAAVINTPAKSWTIPAEEWERLLRVNVVGTAAAIHAFVPAMVKAKNGVIVNFSSGWGRVTSADVGPYCATKYAVEGLTGSLSQELPSGMAAVALNPGIINTDMLASCFGEGAKAYPDPEVWAEKAVPFILGLGAKDNGKPLDVG